MSRLFVCSLTFLSGHVFAQADNDVWQKFPAGVEESSYSVNVPGTGDFQGVSISPPSWFIGIATKRVEVLIYDKDLGKESLQLVGEGATLQGVKRLPNDNYLLAEVLVDPTAKPGTLTFKASDGRSYPWELEVAKQPQKMSPADLVYLIMPDRFANGDPSNDDVEGMKTRGVDRSKVLFRHGGDLKGISDNLSYLSELGVTTLWLNPVLENNQPYESYHGYAVTDHYNIDARFGANQTYLDLVAEAHEKGLKVLMDIVPNHVGDKHFLYADIPASDWFHQPQEFQRSNFRIPSLLDPHAAPEDQAQMLDGWFDHHMPDFNQSNPHVRTYLTQLALWWIGHSGHDGYRVDTYPYSDPAFMATWSEAIHTNFPTVSFFGEVWVDGLPNQASFVPGNNSPMPVGANRSVTDFQLYSAMLEALTQQQSWVGGVGKLWLTLGQDFMYKQPNKNITFLDNHDLTRLATVLNGDEQKIKSALTLLLTLRGTPMVYYGTEIGIEGAGGGFGEGGRKDMPGGWDGDRVNAFSGHGLSPKQSAIQQHVARLANYRKANPGLATGSMMHWIPNDGVYVYTRTAEQLDHKWLVAYNSSTDEKSISLDRYLMDQDHSMLEFIVGGESKKDSAINKSALSKLSLKPFEAVVVRLK